MNPALDLALDDLIKRDSGPRSSGGPSGRGRGSWSGGGRSSAFEAGGRGGRGGGGGRGCEGRGRGRAAGGRSIAERVVFAEGKDLRVEAREDGSVSLYFFEHKLLDCSADGAVTLFSCGQFERARVRACLSEALRLCGWALKTLDDGQTWQLSDGRKLRLFSEGLVLPPDGTPRAAKLRSSFRQVDHARVHAPGGEGEEMDTGEAPGKQTQRRRPASFRPY